MKVSGHNPPDLLASKTPSANNPKVQAEVAQKAASASINPGVALVLTGGTRAMAKDGQGQTAVVDAKKVAAIKAAIAEGSFAPNPEAIADKLLSNAQEMLQATPKQA